MERLRQVAQPDEFTIIKVSKSTLEFIRFDAEIENRSRIPAVISQLDGKVIRLSGFPEPLKVSSIAIGMYFVRYLIFSLEENQKAENYSSRCHLGSSLGSFLTQLGLRTS